MQYWFFKKIKNGRKEIVAGFRNNFIYIWANKTDGCQT